MLVGEIKGLEQGIFLMKTRYSDKDFNIKWHEVEKIWSSRYFITSLNGGKRYTTTINSLKDKKGKVQIIEKTSELIPLNSEKTKFAEVPYLLFSK